METTAAFLIFIGLICFGITAFATARFGTSSIWFIFALLPFALGFLDAYSQLRK